MKCWLLLPFLLLPLACNSDSAMDPSGTVSHTVGDPQPEPVVPPEAKSGLTDRTWHLLLLDGKAPAFPATLRFEDDRAFADAGCNSIQGRYKRSGTRLSFREISMTEMGCNPFALNEFESDYAAALSKTDAFKLNGDQLTLNGGQVLAFETRAP